MPPTATTSDFDAIDAFVRLVRASVAVTGQLSAQLSADHGLTINAYEALLQLAGAPTRECVASTWQTVCC